MTRRPALARLFRMHSSPCVLNASANRFLPIAFVWLRSLYNFSTADQSLSSRFVRAILYFIPLDLNIIFHKVRAFSFLLALFFVV